MSNNSSRELNDALETVQTCYQTLAQLNSNLVREILNQHDTFYEWTHYPPGDVQDKRTLSQYYYHSHPSKDSDRLNEHGHFHLFLREPAIPKQFRPIFTSEKYKKNKTDNLCHLFAISMNNKGFPTGIFTVNHWVTQGLWYDAQQVCAMIDQFEIQVQQFNLVNLWLNAMVKLFKPTLYELIYKRDQVIKAWCTQHPAQEVYADKRLEITSLATLSQP